MQHATAIPLRKNIHNNITTGAVRSNRMYLHVHPTFSLRLKSQLAQQISIFDEKQTEAIIERVYKVAQLDKADLSITTYILEVLTPEITILILKKTEGVHRFQAEMAFLTKGYLE